MKLTLFLITFHGLLAFSFWEYGAANTTEPKSKTQLPPEDALLKFAYYDNASFAIYEKGGEAVVGGKTHQIGGGGYLNALFQTEIVDQQTGDYIVIDTLGVTRYRFGNRSGVCLPALTKDERK